MLFYIIIYIYIYIYIYIFDLYAVFAVIYHEILRITLLHKTANDCFFLCQETCAYAITDSIYFENWSKTCSEISHTIVNISIYAKNKFYL